jgi:peptidyl-prolyl cis-trans isomerase D
MLSFFRQSGAASILGAGIVFAIILVFALEFRPGRQASGAGLAVECALEVQELCVSEKEFYAAYRLMAPPGADAKTLRKLGLRAHVINGLIERELLLKEAERFDLAVGEDELDARLTQGRAQISLPAAHADVLAWQLGLCPRPSTPLTRGCDPGADLGVRMLPVTNNKTGAFDYKKYERVVRTTTNRGAKEFKEMQRREVVAERMRRLVRSRVRVAENEAFLAYEREKSKAVVNTAQVKRDWFAKYIVDTSDAAVDAWATENQSQVDEAWKTDKDKFKAGCPLVSELMVSVLPGASDEDKVILRDKLDKMLAQVKAGEAFETVARESSDGRTALGGGHLGCLSESYGEGSEQLLEAVKNLKRGSLSPVVETKQGFHILKVEGSLAESDVESVGRRQVARMLSVRFRADELAKAFASELIQRVQSGVDLAQATDELAAEYVSRSPTASRKPKLKGTDKDQQNAKEEDKPVALQVPDRPQASVSTPFSILSSPFHNAAPGETPAVKAFALAKPGDVHPTPLETLDGVAVIQLKEKTLATRADFEKDKAVILAQLREAKAAEALQKYVARLRDAAKDKIKISPTIAEEQKGDGSRDDES